jgi:hypothetical protein
MVALALLPVTHVVAADLDSGLVAQHKFDGSYANSLGLELVMVPTDTSFEDGLQGSAVSLQETESHLESIDPFPIVGNSPRTISIWVRLEMFADEKRRLITWGSTDQETGLSSIVIDNNGAAVFHTHSWDVYTAPNVITLNRWHHLPRVKCQSSLRVCTIELAGPEMMQCGVAGTGGAD